MTVSDQIIAVLNDLCTKFGIAIDWSAENVLPYVQQLCEKYIRYEIATSIATPIMILIPLIVCALIWRYGVKIDNDDVYISFSIFTVVIAIAFMVCSIFEVFDVIECLTFPEKAIFEYVKMLMKRG